MFDVLNLFKVPIHTITNGHEKEFSFYEEKF